MKQYQKIMYEIAESDAITVNQEINEATGNKTYKIKGIFSSPGQKNKNGRVYPMGLWESEVMKYQDIMEQGSSNSLLELNHPARSQVDMMEAVAKMNKLYIKEGYVMGEATLLDNPKANQLKTLIDNGIKMSVSSRGVGSVKNGIVESYKLITFDVIPDQGQSDHNASMMGIVEGVLESKEYQLTESGEIEEVLMCSKSACGMYDVQEVQDATKEKFKELFNSMSKMDEGETSNPLKLMVGVWDKIETANTSSNVKAIVNYLNNLTDEEAKENKIDVKKEAKIFSKIAELLSSTKINRLYHI